MNTQELKFNIFLTAALTKKGFKLAELVKLSDEELDKLPLSTTLIQGIKETRDNNFIVDPILLETELTVQVQNNDEHRPVDPELINEYKDVPIVEVQEEIITEQQSNLQEVIEVERVITSTSIINKIKDALEQKEYKLVHLYVKHIKTALTEDELKTVDASMLSDMINARILEIKSK